MSNIERIGDKSVEERLDELDERITLIEDLIHSEIEENVDLTSAEYENVEHIIREFIEAIEKRDEK